MAVLEDIEKEKQRLSERLARLDAQRERLSQELSELESAERVLSRFSSEPGRRRRRGPPARAAAAAGKPKPATRRAQGRARGTRARQQPSISDLALNLVQTHAEGISASELLTQLSNEGHSIRPNHLGIALQRHLRAGRLEQRDQRWYPPPQSESAHEAPTA